MVDIRIVQNLAFPELSVPLDWNLITTGAMAGTLDVTHDIETAILVALGTDKLAEPTDILPDPHSSDRKGWWGDYQASTIWGGWPIGWRGWLLRRTKITDNAAAQGATVTQVQDYLYEAFTPFVTNKILSSFEIDVQRNVHNRQEIDAYCTFNRGNDQIKMQFAIFTNVSSINAVAAPSQGGPIYVVTL